VYAATHAPQSALALTFAGHTEHPAAKPAAAEAEVVHALRHEHVHPVRAVPLTLTALPLQFPTAVHVSAQFGYPLYPSMHAAQSSDALNPNGQMEQSMPVQFARQPHTHAFVTVPETVMAWLEQFPAIVHTGSQFG
jgi:hypothetical protein